MLRLITLVILLSSLFFPHVTQAQGISPQGKLILKPDETTQNTKGYYEINGILGSQYSFQYSVENTGNQAATYTIYPSDALSAAGGGPDFRNPEDKNVLVGKWFLEKAAITKSIMPGEIQFHTFNVKIPSNVQSGQYVGAIVMKETPTKNTAQKTNGENEATYVVNVVHRSAIHTVINVSKGVSPEEHKMSFKAPIFEDPTKIGSDGRVVLSVPILNEGSVLEKPRVSIQLIDKAKNEVIENKEYEFASVYPDTESLLIFTPSTVLKTSDYKFKYRATYHNQTIEGQYEFSISKNELKRIVTNLENSNLISVPEDLFPENELGANIVILVLASLVVVLIAYIFVRSRKNKSNDVSG